MLKVLTMVALSLFLLGCSTSQQPQVGAEAQSKVRVLTPNEGHGPGSTIVTSVDGDTSLAGRDIEVVPGEHQLGVACTLENGVSLTFSLNLDLEQGYSYCVFALDQGKSCKIAYAKRALAHADGFVCTSPKTDIAVKKPPLVSIKP